MPFKTTRAWTIRSPVEFHVLVTAFPVYGTMMQKKAITCSQGYVGKLVCASQGKVKPSPLSNQKRWSSSSGPCILAYRGNSGSVEWMLAPAPPTLLTGLSTFTTSTAFDVATHLFKNNIPPFSVAFLRPHHVRQDLRVRQRRVPRFLGEVLAEWLRALEKNTLMSQHVRRGVKPVEAFRGSIEGGGDLILHWGAHPNDCCYRKA